MRDRGIPIEINLTSSLQTRVVSNAAIHPLRRSLDEGQAVTSWSDNWPMGDVTLSSAYSLAAGERGVARLILNGVRAGFLPNPDRGAPLQEVIARIVCT